MGPGARKSHKSAKMFYINCAEKEGKKLCKKYKQNPKPTTMQYWREGLFYKEFHREETPKAGFTPTRRCPQDYSVELKFSARVSKRVLKTNLSNLNILSDFRNLTVLGLKIQKLMLSSMLKMKSKLKS